MQLVGWKNLPNEQTEVYLGYEAAVEKTLYGLEAQLYLAQHQDEADAIMQMERK